MSTTTADRNAALAVILAVAETIRESSPCANGIVYAALASKGCTMQQYDAIIGQLVAADLVSVSHGQQILTWVGPQLQEAR